MPTWFKIRAKERKCVARIIDGEIVNAPILEWIDYPTQVDLELKRIIHFQPLLIEDEGVEPSTTNATFIQWSDGSSSYAPYEYGDFKAKMLPTYNKLINKLDVKMRVADVLVSDMSEEEINEILNPHKEDGKE